MATITWNNGIWGDWSNAANWVGGIVPGATDSVVIGDTGTGAVNISGTVQVASLSEVITASGGFGEVDLFGSLTLSGALTLAANSPTSVSGPTFFLGAGATLTAAGGVSVGYGDVLEDGGTPGSIQTINANITNDYLIIAWNHLVINGSVSGAGTGSLRAYGGILELNGATSQTVDLEDKGTLKLDSGTSFIGGIEVSGQETLDLAAGATFNPSRIDFFNTSGANGSLATLDLKGIVISSDSFSGHTLSLTESSGQMLNLTSYLWTDGNFNSSLPAGYSPVTQSDGAGGTLISFQQVDVWNDGVSGDWSNAANWVMGVAPVAGDNVLIQGSQVENITIGTPVSINSLTINDLHADLIDGSSLTVSGALTIDSANVTINSGCTLSASGGIVIAAQAPDGSSRAIINSYGGTINGNIVDNGTVWVGANSGVTLINGSVSGSGTLGIGANATLELNGSVAQNITVLLGVNNTLKLDQAANFVGTIDVLPGDTGSLDLGGSQNFGGKILFEDIQGALDLKNVTIASSSYNGATLILQETNGQTLDLAIGADFAVPANASLVAGNDGSGGTLISYLVPQTQNWKAGVSGSWSTAADWVSGVAPGANDAVVIGGTSAETVTISAPAAAQSVTFSDPQATLNINSSLTLQGGLSIDGLAYFDWNSGGGVITAPSGVTIDPTGELLVGSGKVVGSVINNSTDVVSGTQTLHGLLVEGSLQITGSLTGTGTTDLRSSLEVGGAVSQNILFTDGSTLKLDDPAAFTGSLSNFSASYHGGSSLNTNRPFLAGDQIDLAGVAVGNLSYNGSVLTVTDTNNHTYNFNLTSSSTAPLNDATPTFASDGAGGSDIYWQAGLNQTWAQGVSGDWASAVNWVSGVTPGAYDNVAVGGTSAETITVAAGETAQANQLTVTDQNAQFSVLGTLDLGFGPGFAGNVISVSGALNLAGGGTLDSATITLTGGEISAYSVTGGSSLTAPNLTFGTQLQLEAAQASTYSDISAANLYNYGGIKVDGTLHIDTPLVSGPGGGLGPSSPEFDNYGTVNVSASGDLEASGKVFNNQGTFTIGAGASATLGISPSNTSLNSAGWTNNGSISVGAGATLTLIGDFSTASLAKISYAGGTLVLDGAPTDVGTLSQYNGSFRNDYSGGTSTLTAQGGTLVLDTAYVNNTNPGNPSSGNPILQALTSGAQLAIDTGATLELSADQGPYSSYAFYSPPQITNGYSPNPYVIGNITFNGANATLKLDRPDVFYGSLSGLQFGELDRFHRPDSHQRNDRQSHGQRQCLDCRPPERPDRNVHHRHELPGGRHRRLQRQGRRLCDQLRKQQDAAEDGQHRRELRYPLLRGDWNVRWRRLCVLRQRLYVARRPLSGDVL